MPARLSGFSDPFEGRGARRREIRLKIEGLLALAMAIAACGLTLAWYIRTLAPLASVYGLG
ncbi:MAG TPA: hypothetical protein VFX65_11540 [Candidatus Limnocylindrales bacterium]|nr:hypothetical protein [Candidatus Limnocylindrales bacterium]